MVPEAPEIRQIRQVREKSWLLGDDTAAGEENGVLKAAMSNLQDELAAAKVFM